MSICRPTVYRETPFSVIIDKDLMSGRFDRLVVEHDAEGRPLRVTIIDYKSDRVDNESKLAAAVERHSSQMEAYRKGTAKLTGLVENKIEALLMFTRIGRVEKI